MMISVLQNLCNGGIQHYVVFRVRHFQLERKVQTATPHYIDANRNCKVVMGRRLVF